ncbi:MAG: hypothetical protein RR336_03960, partial [Oscillospiraceae bacterium]
DDLSTMLKREDLSNEDRKYFADKMIEVADKIGLKDTEGKDFKGKLLNTIGGIILGSLLIAVRILGGKYIDTNGKNSLNL